MEKKKETIKYGDLMSEERALHESETWLEQKLFDDITEEMYQRGSFTVYIIHASADNKLYEGVGFGKARQEIGISKYDSDRGKKVAKGRAIHDLFQEYKKLTKRR